MGNRARNYLGPGLDIEPSALDKYEATGRYTAGVKIDGMWADNVVGNPNEGRPNVLSSRDASTGPVLDDRKGDLDRIQLPWPGDTIIVGELEAATEWATEEVARRGYRRMHVFDVVAVGGKCVKGLTWEQRRELLTMMYRSKADVIMDRFPVIEPHTSGFRALYDQAVADGHEGVVLWDRTAPYAASRGDGKADTVIRCKRHFTKDYVLFALARTPSGVLTGEWGLYKNGKLSRTMQAACPPEFLRQENVGRLVVEFKGAKLFKSGAFRHASYVRVRTDKPAEQCTL